MVTSAASSPCCGCGCDCGCDCLFETCCPPHDCDCDCGCGCDLRRASGPSSCCPVGWHFTAPRRGKRRAGGECVRGMHETAVSFSTEFHSMAASYTSSFLPPSRTGCNDENPSRGMHEEQGVWKWAWKWHEPRQLPTHGTSEDKQPKTNPSSAKQARRRFVLTLEF